ncbi:MAG: hypothetical protein HYY52_00335 [Candidatus Melainabacteria bacterium]|nr:hypothetical protein [Candidatus Melainabacteria bacterium]
MPKKYLFKINTPIGLNIRTTQEYWELIQIKHPETTMCLTLIKNTLKMPDLITKSKIDNNVLLFYKRINSYWICVVTKSMDLDGFIITAYITDKIKEGEKI